MARESFTINHFECDIISIQLPPHSSLSKKVLFSVINDEAHGSEGEQIETTLPLYFFSCSWKKVCVLKEKLKAAN